jgi:hypothetical protein
MIIFFENIDSNYLRHKAIASLSVGTLDEYIPQAKQCIDFYRHDVKDDVEKNIQQLIIKENNYSVNAPDTDFSLSIWNILTAAITNALILLQLVGIQHDLHTDYEDLPPHLLF